MSNTEQPSSGSKCPSCQTGLHPDAKFCHECGALAGDQRDPKRWEWRIVAPVSVLIGIVAVGAGLILVLGIPAAEQKDLLSSPQSDVINSSRQVEQPVDLSTMTPREAADRLFNRVMAADERGDAAQSIQFAPMALQAYQLVDRLDADAHYHLGLINLLLENLDEVREQIENLKRDSADHLLGLALAFRVAKRVGDDKSASEILARLAAAYDAEIRRGKPEYEAHRVTLEKLQSSTASLKTTKNPK